MAVPNHFSDASWGEIDLLLDRLVYDEVVAAELECVMACAFRQHLDFDIGLAKILRGYFEVKHAIST